jgi:5-formyltetrahydrofolate cyclo-ligase
MNKNELREKMRAMRRSLTADETAEKSEKIQRLLFGYEKYKSAKTVMLYISAFKEPSTIEIVKDALEQGKRVIVPISNTDTETLTLSYIDGFDELEKGAYGILEPKIIKPANAADIDFILVPGIAFDYRGSRMGFGKGYYDKLLCGCNAEKTALCYAFQLLDEIPSDTHDVPMDTIITEEKIYVI